MAERNTDKTALAGKECCERVVVLTPTWYKIEPCENRAKVIEDGKPYCGIHDPEKQRARSEFDLDFARLREDHRRLSRYKEAVNVLRAGLENCGCALPGPCDADEILKAIAADPENINGYCEWCLEAAAFLAAEPKEPA